PAGLSDAGAAGLAVERLLELAGPQAKQGGVPGRDRLREWQRASEVHHRAGQAGDLEAVDRGDLVVGERCPVHLDPTPGPPSAPSVAGEVDSLKALLPHREVVHGGREVWLATALGSHWGRVAS